MAKNFVLKFINNIIDKDNISIIEFDYEANEILPLTKGAIFKNNSEKSNTQHFIFSSIYMTQKS